MTSEDYDEAEIEAILNEELSEDSQDFDSQELEESPIRASPTNLHKTKYSLQYVPVTADTRSQDQ